MRCDNIVNIRSILSVMWRVWTPIWHSIAFQACFHHASGASVYLNTLLAPSS